MLSKNPDFISARCQDRMGRAVTVRSVQPSNTGWRVHFKEQNTPRMNPNKKNTINLLDRGGPAVFVILSLLVSGPAFRWWHVFAARNFTSSLLMRHKELKSVLSSWAVSSWVEQSQPLGKTWLGREGFRLACSFVLSKVSSAPNEIPLCMFVSMYR